MSCALYRSNLMELARGAPVDPRAVMHVDTCESCRDFLAAQRRLTASLRGVAASPAASLPTGLENELLAEFDAVRGAAKRPRLFWVTAGAFAIAAMALITVVILRQTPESPLTAPVASSVRTPDTPAPPPSKDHALAAARPVTMPPRPLRIARAKPQPKQEDTQEAAFISIPYTMPLAPNERADVVRMDVPVAALIAAGYPMQVQDVGAKASADVLVGEDGRARAVRLVSVANSNFNRSFK